MEIFRSSENWQRHNPRSISLHISHINIRHISKENHDITKLLLNLLQTNLISEIFDYKIPLKKNFEKNSLKNCAQYFDIFMTSEIMTSEIMTFCHDLQISEKVYTYFYLSFTGKT